MRKITKMVVGLLVVIGLTSSAQADIFGACGLGSDGNTFTRVIKLKDGTSIYTSPALKAEGKYYLKITRSSLYTPISKPNFSSTMENISGDGIKVCEVDDDKFVEEEDYDRFEDNSENIIRHNQKEQFLLTDRKKQLALVELRREQDAAKVTVDITNEIRNVYKRNVELEVTTVKLTHNVASLEAYNENLVSMNESLVSEVRILKRKLQSIKTREQALDNKNTLLENTSKEDLQTIIKLTKENQKLLKKNESSLDWIKKTLEKLLNYLF